MKAKVAEPLSRDFWNTLAFATSNVREKMSGRCRDRPGSHSQFCLIELRNLRRRFGELCQNGFDRCYQFLCQPMPHLGFIYLGVKMVANWRAAVTQVKREMFWVRLAVCRVHNGNDS